jgi:hypothetical protein
MPRLAIVSVHYYPRWLKSSLEELSRIAALVGADHCILINNNPALQADLVQAAAGHAFVNSVALHDNSGQEFGAYQLGLDKALQAGEFDWVLFLNDSFSTHQPFFSRYRMRLVECLSEPGAAELAVIVGKVSSLPRSYVIAGARSHRWMNTHIFALNRKALSVLNGRVHHPKLDRFVHPVADLDQFFGKEIDETLANHLKAWLFGALPGPRWGRAAPLTVSNATAFAAKARAILQEKYLSASLEESSAYFFDLHSMDRFGRALCLWERFLFDARIWLRNGRARIVPGASKRSSVSNA